MNFTNITKNASKIVGRGGLILKKYSPEILLVVGIGGTVVSTVMTAKATLRVEEVMHDHKVTVGEINKCWEKVKEGTISLDTYSEKDHKKDLTITYVRTGKDLVRLYGPAVTLEVASIVCIVSSFGIMKKRNVALVAAYKTLEEGFNSYRKRVIEDFGEEKDYMYKNGLRSEQVTETEVGEDGKTKKVKKTKYSVDPNSHSIYARFFDESSNEWQKNSEYNLMYLKSQQNMFNDLLKVRGHVFLNEVYDALGIPRSQAGTIVGWVIGKDRDNYIDFGLFDGNTPKQRDFVNGNERSLLLDFNVDGVIYDLIEENK